MNTTIEVLKQAADALAFFSDNSIEERALRAEIERLEEQQPVAIDRLLPCPFCGGEAGIDRYGDNRVSTIYECNSCGCRLETCEEFNHGAVWNTRHPASAVEKCEPVAWQHRVPNTTQWIDGKAPAEWWPERALFTHPAPPDAAAQIAELVKRPDEANSLIHKMTRQIAKLQAELADAKGIANSAWDQVWLVNNKLNLAANALRSIQSHAIGSAYILMVCKDALGKIDRGADGMTEEDDKQFNRQWDVK